PDGTLTKLGRRATRKTRFAGIAAEQARARLKVAGVTPRRMNTCISDGLAARPPRLPTARYLWEELEPELGFREFSQLLTLLGECEAAEVSRRKLFLSLSSS
ncbi:MAG: hypothetical protein MJE66_22875, partial [Proteobacteria bacterium]|nr:hypothetical protein [Pseudomonadota bacterium]